MIGRAELEGWTHEERAELMRTLVDLEAPAVEPPLRRRRLRDTIRVLVTAGAVVLIPWSIYLAASLPRRTVTSHWRAAWVGFDILLIVSLAATAYLGWRVRQMVVVGLLTTAVLLICDAWFDVMLTSGTDRWVSLAMALLVELPLAVLFLVAARGLFTATAEFMWVATGRQGSAPPLHRMPIVTQLPAVANDGADDRGDGHW
jgi:hypothetical protein